MIRNRTICLKLTQKSGRVFVQSFRLIGQVLLDAVRREDENRNPIRP